MRKERDTGVFRYAYEERERYGCVQTIMRGVNSSIEIANQKQEEVVQKKFNSLAEALGCLSGFLEAQDGQRRQPNHAPEAQPPRPRPLTVHLRPYRPRADWTPPYLTNIEDVWKHWWIGRTDPAGNEVPPLSLIQSLRNEASKTYKVRWSEVRAVMRRCMELVDDDSDPDVKRALDELKNGIVTQDRVTTVWTCVENNLPDPQVIAQAEASFRPRAHTYRRNPRVSVKKWYERFKLLRKFNQQRFRQ